MILPLEEYEFRQNMLHIEEVFLIPLYFFLLLIIASRLKGKFCEPQDYKKFLIFICIKMLGGLAATLVHNLYYAGGDTTAYFNDGRLLNKLFFTNPMNCIKLFFSGNIENQSDAMQQFFNGFRFTSASDTWLVCKFSAILSIFSANYMGITTLFFGFLTALPIWCFYKRLATIYPGAKRGIAIGILWMPNLIFWGSGIMKDSICVAFIAMVFVCFHNAFIWKKQIFKNIIYLIVLVWLLAIIKSYIAATFVIGLLIWKIADQIYAIKSLAIKAPIIILILVLSYQGAQQLQQLASAKIQESLIDDLLVKASNQSNYLQYVSENNDGSSYNLGEITADINSMISLAPKAINVSLFRPYPWESRKPIILFAAFESFFVLLLTIYIFIIGLLYKPLVIILKDPFLLFCLFFVIIFSAITGLTSMNFGTLVRYKIPLIPFFISMLFIIKYKLKHYNYKAVDA